MRGEGFWGGEEEYVLCLIYHGCRRGSVDCSAGRENCMLVESWTISLFWEITKSMTHIARIQSKDTHYKLRSLFQISISTAHT